MNLIETLMKVPHARKATQFISAKLVVKASRRHKFSGRSSRHEYLVTMGAPNYEERRIIQCYKKAGKKVPTRSVFFKYWPEKKRG
jgi:hypothetical protein